MKKFPLLGGRNFVDIPKVLFFTYYIGLVNFIIIITMIVRKCITAEEESHRRICWAQKP